MGNCGLQKLGRDIRSESARKVETDPARAGFHEPTKRLVWERQHPCRSSVATGDGPQITVQLLTRKGSPTIEHVHLQDNIEAAICHALGMRGPLQVCFRDQPIHGTFEEWDIEEGATLTVAMLQSRAERGTLGIGDNHSACTTEEGTLYTWGHGVSGRLGHGDESSKSVPTPVEALVGHVVVQLALGYYHSACTTEEGTLYTWGNGVYEQLGHGDESSKSVPTPVEALVGHVVVQLALGTGHSACTTEDGSLYTWGNGGNGRLGHGDGSDKSVPTPVC